MILNSTAEKFNIIFLRLLKLSPIILAIYFEAIILTEFV